MATSSITTDFVISGKEAVERFANAVEELRKFIERTLEVNGKSDIKSVELSKNCTWLSHQVQFLNLNPIYNNSANR